MITYQAHAKLNLSLAIEGLAANGYHLLDMVMQEISLHDMVRVGRADEISVHCGSVCEEERNTAYKIARLFFEYTGLRHGARIVIVKNIPAQAGLGGGSSDAACTLLALNTLYRTNLKRDELRQLAVQIGADVPFFLHGGCMRAGGIGEQLHTIQNRCNFRYLLVKPQTGVDTRQAYDLYDTLGGSVSHTDAVVAALERGDAQAYFENAKNALTRAALQLAPAVGRAADDLAAAGARFTMMTGSGSCVFGIFQEDAKLAAAERALRGKYPFVFAARNAIRPRNA